MNCKVCGNVIDEQTVFCTNCGAKAEAPVSEETVTTKAADLHTTADLSEVEAALHEVARQTEDMPVEMVRSEEEKLGDMMEKADRMVDEFTTGQPEEVPGEEEEEAVAETEEPVPAYDNDVVEEVAVTVVGESRGEKRIRIKAEREEAKLRFVIAKNPAAVTVFNVILAIMFTGALFVAASIFMLAHSSFDKFYSEVVFANIKDNIDFWVLTCSWYAIAMYTILALLAVLMFFVLKRRRYAVLNYVGIPAIVNGVVFLLIGYFSSQISDIFSFTGIIEELFEVIESTAGEMIMWNAVVILGFGVVAVFVYVITSAIHKAVYRRKCRKAENR